MWEVSSFIKQRSFISFVFFLNWNVLEQIYMLFKFSVSKHVILSKEIFLYFCLYIDRFVLANIIMFCY
jgi:hypothetical protein